jgi:hypothetical protein
MKPDGLFCVFVCEQISSITAQSHTVGLLSIPYQTLWEEAQLCVSVCSVIIHDSKALKSSKEEKKHARKAYGAFEYTY